MWFFCCSSGSRLPICALLTGVKACALPICMSLEARLLDAARDNVYLAFTGDWKASLLVLIAALAPYPATAQADSRSDLPPPQPLRELPRQPRGQRAPWRANASDWGRTLHAALAAVARLEIDQLQAGARHPACLFEMPKRGRDRKSTRLNSRH